MKARRAHYLARTGLPERRVGSAELARIGPVMVLDRDPGPDRARQAALDADIMFEG